jgi:hypothetical protein
MPHSLKQIPSRFMMPLPPFTLTAMTICICNNNVARTKRPTMWKYALEIAASFQLAVFYALLTHRL